MLFRSTNKFGCRIGGVAGYNKGKGIIKNCNVNNGEIKAALNEAIYCGGISGYNEGQILDCFSTAKIEGTQDKTGEITGCNDGIVSGN